MTLAGIFNAKSTLLKPNMGDEFDLGGGGGGGTWTGVYTEKSW